MEIILTENILNVYFSGKLLTFFPYFLTSVIPFPPLWLRVKFRNGYLSENQGDRTLPVVKKKVGVGWGEILVASELVCAKSGVGRQWEKASPGAQLKLQFPIPLNLACGSEGQGKHRLPQM